MPPVNLLKSARCPSFLCDHVCAASVLAKPCSGIFRSPSQKSNVAAYSCEVESERDETFDRVDIARQCTRGLSCCPDALGGIFDGGLHFRMAGIAKLTEVPGKVARTDEKT